MVSDEPTEGRCNAAAGEDKAGYCESWPVTDDDGEPVNGRCRMHGGTNKGAPKENTNNVSHGLFSQVNKFYSNVMSDELRDLCDEIFENYVGEYTERHGEPHTGHETRLFEISINHIKVIYSDNWASDRPEELESGNPMVDKETSFKTTQDGDVIPEKKYKASVVTKTQQKLRKEDRAWLREYGLLDDPESQKADAAQSIVDLLSE